jgi:hypothetical protein
MRGLARRLLAASRTASDPPVHDAVAVCERLRIALTKFAGAEGFAALLRRALALARAEAPSLQSVKLGSNCHMEGLDEVTPDAAVALAAHLLELLVTFIGEPLALRIMREGWPDESFGV